MQKKMSMTKNAFATPGIDLISAMMILLSDSTRLNRRNTRKARSSFSWSSGGWSALIIVRKLTVTMTVSNMFQPEAQNIRTGPPWL